MQIHYIVCIQITKPEQQTGLGKGLNIRQYLSYELEEDNMMPLASSMNDNI